MSLHGTKRTCRGLACNVRFRGQTGHGSGWVVMSAFDPKRTLAHPSKRFPECYSFALGWLGVGPMRRREFLGALGGAAVAWPVVARGQQGERVRRIGVLMNTAPDHPEGKARLAIFRQALQALGWADGQNVRIDARGTSAIVENFRKHAAELVAATPDVVLAVTTNAVLE